MTRYAAIHVPSLRLQLLECDRPALSGTAWVLGTRRQGAQSRVLDASSCASDLGIEPGMHLSDLGRRVPRAQIVEPDPHLLSRFRRILSAFCEARTGAWEVSDDGDAILDLGAVAHLVGGDIEAWAARFRSDLRIATGIHDIRVAIAPSRSAAEILVRVRTERPILLASEADLPDLLASIPLGRIPWLGRSLREQIERSGIRQLSDVARFPHAFFRQHFGDSGERLSALARGLDVESSTLVAPALAEEHVFRREESDYASQRERVHELADRLSFALRERELAATEVRLRAVWSDGQELSTSVRAVPSCGTFLALRETAWKLLSELSARRQPLRALRLTAARTEPVAVQEDLFGAPAPRRGATMGMAAV